MGFKIKKFLPVMFLEARHLAGFRQLILSPSDCGPVLSGLSSEPTRCDPCVESVQES